MGREWMHGLHGRWFELSSERFAAIHYASKAPFKVRIFLLNPVAYVALRIVL